MKHAVITGSSSGIGFGLATEFLKNGFSVTISGKNNEKLNSAGENLIKSFSKDSVHIQTCDVRSCSDIENLWNSAKNRFGHIDIWVNNAGTGQDFIFIKDFEEDAINLILDTNIKGVIHASRIIYNKMSEQGFGAVYNMEGFGSDGRKMQKLSIYGTSKSALSYFTKSFIKETKQSSVLIGTISPGMVLTDLFLRPSDRDEKEAKRFLKITNILADKVETVTPWLVNKMINNTTHGKSFNWLNSTKVMTRFISSLFKKRKLLSLADIRIKKH
ncbi:MAG: SDR family oxidoreductase [Chlorobi bacterium]|nr:SDR family oxidoreductase [Chlorobiota bacterium]